MREPALEELKALYFEVTAFFRECGGSYRNLPESTCLNIADALHHGRYIIHREDSKIVRAVMYWRVNPSELALVAHGMAPAEKESGSIIYLCEHAGTDRGLYKMIRELKSRYPGDACWHDRWVAPDRFRYYRRQSR